MCCSFHRSISHNHDKLHCISHKWFRYNKLMTKVNDVLLDESTFWQKWRRLIHVWIRLARIPAWIFLGFLIVSCKSASFYDRRNVHFMFLCLFRLNTFMFALAFCSFWTLSWMKKINVLVFCHFSKLKKYIYYFW